MRWPSAAWTTIHALLSLPATMSIAKGAQVLKANSSRWVNQGRPTRFEWQEGYFACSVSRSQISRVMKYNRQPARAPQENRPSWRDGTASENARPRSPELMCRPSGTRLPYQAYRALPCPATDCLVPAGLPQIPLFYSDIRLSDCWMLSGREGASTVLAQRARAVVQTRRA